jgi:hypothetical protein
MTLQMNSVFDRALTFITNFALLSGLVLGAAMFVSLSN